MNILLIEDDSRDAALLRRCDGFSRMRHCVDGQSSLDSLAADPVPPDMILLDWLLPGLSGKAVLDRLRSQDLTRRIPIFVLTASRDPADADDAYAGHANAFILKPVDGNFSHVANALNKWMRMSHCARPLPRTGFDDPEQRDAASMSW